MNKEELKVTINSVKHTLLEESSRCLGMSIVLYNKSITTFIDSVLNKLEVLHEPEECECINTDCGWIGLTKQCITFKHDGRILCPECHEVVEYGSADVAGVFSPNTARENMSNNSLENLQGAAKVGFEFCQELQCAHADIILRNKKEEPVAAFVCTTDKELAKRIESVLIAYDIENEEDDDDLPWEDFN